MVILFFVLFIIFNLLWVLYYIMLRLFDLDNMHLVCDNNTELFRYLLYDFASNPKNQVFFLIELFMIGLTLYYLY